MEMRCVLEAMSSLREVGSGRICGIGRRWRRTRRRSRLDGGWLGQRRSGVGFELPETAVCFWVQRVCFDSVELEYILMGPSSLSKGGGYVTLWEELRWTRVRLHNPSFYAMQRGSRNDTHAQCELKMQQNTMIPQRCVTHVRKQTYLDHAVSLALTEDDSLSLLASICSLSLR